MCISDPQIALETYCFQRGQYPLWDVFFYAEESIISRGYKFY